MGLDMYFFQSSEDCGNLTSFITDEKEVHYWRKHPSLNQFFHQKLVDNHDELLLDCLKFKREDYTRIASTLANVGFNSLYLKVDIKMLKELEQRIKDETLEHMGGFFFGESENTPEEKADDLEAIEKAKKILYQGGHLYYYNNW